MRWGRQGSAIRVEVVGPGQLVDAVRDLSGAADAEVAGREDVLAPEMEDQEHLGGPLPDPLDLDQLGDHVLVVEVTQVLEVEPPVLDALGEVP